MPAKWKKLLLALPLLLLGLAAANIASWRPQTLKISLGEAFQVAFSTDGQWLAVASHGAAPDGDEHRRFGRVDIFRVTTPHRFQPPHAKSQRTWRVYSPASICFSGDSQTLICTGYDQKIRRWNVATGEEIGAVKKKGFTGTFAQSLPQGDEFSFWTDTFVEQRAVKTGRLKKRQRLFPPLPDEEDALPTLVVARSPDGKRSPTSHMITGTNKSP